MLDEELLTPQQQRDLQNHLRGCTSCSGIADSNLALHSRHMAAPAAGFTERFRPQLSAWRREQQRRQAIGTVILVVIGVSLLYALAGPAMLEAARSPAAWLGQVAVYAVELLTLVSVIGQVGGILLRHVPRRAPLRSLARDGSGRWVAGSHMDSHDAAARTSAARSWKMKKSILYWLMLAMLVLAPITRAYADDGTSKDRVIIGQNFTLKSGDSIDGDLIVIGGETAIESGRRGTGRPGRDWRQPAHGWADLQLGDRHRRKRLAGRVKHRRARPRGVGRRISARRRRDHRRRHHHQSLPSRPERLPRAAIAHRRSFPPTRALNLDFGPLGTLASVLFQAISLGAIAMLLTAFLHPQLDRVAQAAWRSSRLQQEAWDCLPSFWLHSRS